MVYFLLSRDLTDTHQVLRIWLACGPAVALILEYVCIYCFHSIRLAVLLFLCMYFMVLQKMVLTIEAFSTYITLIGSLTRMHFLVSKKHFFLIEALSTYGAVIRSLPSVYSFMSNKV